MTESGFIDPLQATEELVELILKSSERKGDIEILARAIDKLLYALRFAQSEDIPPIEESDLEPTRIEYSQLREIISRKFPNLGFYWVASNTNIDKKGELVTSDAIDDLADIVDALSEVLWFTDHVSRLDGLAALKFRYSSHIRAHLLPLRVRLDDLIYEGYL
jgi:hypothetical protein